MSDLFAIAASDEEIRDVVEEALRAGQGAVAAALSGFFAAAGAHPGVLLGPFAMMVASAGASRVFDGRLRQPGLGVRRPRGFTSEQAIPRAAYLAVPTTALAVSVALSYSGVSSLDSIVRPGIAAARRAEAPRRKAALEALVGQGAGAFAHPPFSRPLLLAGAPSEGGNLSVADLAATPAVDRSPDRTAVDGGSRYASPWTPDDAANAEPATLRFRGVSVVDRQGSFAALAYEQAEEGIEIDALGLIAPIAATPVLRGISRLTPGAALPMNSCLWIDRDASSRAVRAGASPGSDDGAARLAVELQPDTGRARVASG